MLAELLQMTKKIEIKKSVFYFLLVSHYLVRSMNKFEKKTIHRNVPYFYIHSNKAEISYDEIKDKVK